MVYAWTQTGEMIISPLATLWFNLIELIPSLIAALVVIMIGWFIALVLGHVVRIILEKLKIDEKIRNAKMTKEIGHIDMPMIFGEVTKWYIFIVFLQQAVGLLSLGTLTNLLDLKDNYERKHRHPDYRHNPLYARIG